MRALVIGGNGQIGRYVLGAFRDLGWEAIGTTHLRELPGLRMVDIQYHDGLYALHAELQPDVTVLCAGLHDVDCCEIEGTRARGLNAIAPREVAAAAREAGGGMIHVSTEQVFDGAAGPYGEDDTARPLSVYGRTKREAEELVLAAHPRALVVRTSAVYCFDPDPRHYLGKLRERLGRGAPARIPSDQLTTPTYAPDLGRAIAELAERDVHGIVHVAGPERTSRHAFAVEAARGLGLDPRLVVPVETASLGRAAERPLQAGLRIDRLRALVGWTPRALAEALLELRPAMRVTG